MQHAAAPPFQACPGFASRALRFSGTKIRVETLFNHLYDGGTIDEFDSAVSRDRATCAIEMAARESVQRREHR